MKKIGKFIIAFLLFSLGVCCLTACDIGSFIDGYFAWGRSFSVVDEEIITFLTEHSFAYEREYRAADGEEQSQTKETAARTEEAQQEARYTVSADEASAVLHLTQNEGGSSFLSLTLTDPLKNLDGKIYDLSDLFGWIRERAQSLDPASLMTEEYLVKQTEEETVYQNPSGHLHDVYEFSVTLGKDGYTFYIYDEVAEDYYYS